MKISPSGLLVTVALDFLGTVAPGAARIAAADSCLYGRLSVPDAALAPTAAAGHTLAIFYAVPTDVPYNGAVLARIKASAANVQAWYQCASGGMTWEFAYPETVRVYNAVHDRLYYKNNGDWWGSLPSEMDASGRPIWKPGIVTAIWAHGAGWWAGAAWGCASDCGTALLGVELFPEFNNPAYSGGTCPGGSGGAAWPCTPDGAFAHELGHTLGLPHPADVPATSAVAPHSVMQTHWNYPTYAAPGERPWGFLSLERQTLLANAFMGWGQEPRQPYAGCDIVNLPSSGAPPAAAFMRDVLQAPNTFRGINTSTGAAYAYWMFGDGAVSNATDGLHPYVSPGAYSITLRAMAANAMMDSAAAPFQVPVLDVPPGTDEAIALSPASPNPFYRTTHFTFRLPSAGNVDLSVHDLTGRRVSTLVSGNCEAGRWSVMWNGEDDEHRHVPPGVYFVRLLAKGRLLAREIIFRE